MVKNFEDIFIRFDVIHERDRRTDGQTDRQTLRDSIDLACIASRGKNCARGIVLLTQLLKDTKHRAASLRQQSFLSCIEGGLIVEITADVCDGGP